MPSRINTYSSKEVNLALKHHDTIADICTKYGCTEDEFQKQLTIIFRPQALQKVLAKFRDNEKQRKRDNVRSKSRATKQLRSEAKRTAEATNKDAAGPADVAQLRKQEKDCSAQIMDLERQHKELARHRRDHLRNLRALQDNLEQLKAQLTSYITEYQQIATKANDLTTRMNTISAKRRQSLKELDRVRQEILEQEVISIYFYSDGQIEPMSDSPFKPDDTGKDNIYQQLLVNQLCNKLRLCDIQILTTAVAIANNTPRKIDAIFDNSELDDCFAQLIAPPPR